MTLNVICKSAEFIFLKIPLFIVEAQSDTTRFRGDFICKYVQLSANPEEGRESEAVEKGELTAQRVQDGIIRGEVTMFGNLSQSMKRIVMIGLAAWTPRVS